MAATETAVQTFKNLINGEWVEAASGETFTTMNPANVKDTVGRFQASTEEDVIQAMEAAEQAFKTWRHVPPTKRAEILYKAADLLEAGLEQYAEELTREEGKTVASSRMEVKRSAQTLRYYASEGLNVSGETLPSDDATTFVYTRKEPLGVISVITPWNFPISIPVRKIAPALVTGNTVVFKPASNTPLIAYRLVEALHQADLPAGVINFVTGSASKTGVPLVTHSAVKAVTFTGSTGAGEKINRQVRLSTRVQLELGGKNPLIVMDDANIDHAVELAVKGGFELTGQACTGTSRVIIMDAVHDEFVEKLVEKTKQLKVGNGLSKGVDVGPLANESQLRNVLDYVAIGKAEGAELVVGGEQLTDGDYANGYYVTPAVFVGVAPDMRIAQEEIFGPVISVIRVSSFQEAMDIANDVEFGLSAAICTSESGRIQHFIQNIETGMVKINRPTTGNAYNAPFGGVKMSSTATYRESGRAALDFYTQIKTVYHGI
ncbi:aldehyde dehydrogenase family protein [Paenibacillus sp. CGMCC 1.16610]|uniref:Aldehyde dehydrogenase family protein n=1 Tax=Paenibacillus anseongense TaxID=2682845 RepID=A0ABW9UEN8_9BACL|nr:MULTISPECIES: aldehyde dehydrogenase family protein [Paenibacillus]MBA2940188.1 aldehyde dehydrogenase family protein [Paenibacillus sp. CGMCC 1.16610]MVQ38642.1 aldehyde dehydrogenase family protein [Paenibacillus anseongense]